RPLFSYLSQVVTIIMPHMGQMEAIIMATIFTRTNKAGNVRYFGNIQINGKRVRKYLGTSKRVAQQALSELEYSLRFEVENNDNRNNKVTFQQASISFLRDIELKGISDGHIYVIMGKLKVFNNFLMHNNISLLSDVKITDAHNFIIKRTKVRLTNKYNSAEDDHSPGLKSVTLNKDIQRLKRFFNYCIDMEWIDRNPFRAVKPFKVKSNGQRYHFTPDQLELIMAQAG
ncbi:uncharacterized protein METZ01_LOCUS517093, partial [marine metagenome]